MSTFRPIRRSGGRATLRGNTIRPVEWIRDCDQGAVPPDPAVLGLVIVEAAEFDDFTRPTVVRVRGELLLHITDITAGGNAVVVYGITIVNPGEPSPNPFAERRGNRWMYWGCSALQEIGATVALEALTSAYRHTFDVKSMRKRMVDGSNLQFCFTIMTGGAGVQALLSASTLIKE